MCALSAVVVDLPLVPVIAISGALRRAGGALARVELDVANDFNAG